LFTRFLGEATKAAQSDNATSRLAVATLLGAMGDYSAVFLLPQHGVFARQVTPLLTALMKDKDPQVSATAARSLAQINGDPQKAAPAFHEMLKPSNPVARRRAAAEAVLIYLTLKTQYINASDRRVGRADMITVAQNIVPVVGQGLRDADVS